VQPQPEQREEINREVLVEDEPVPANSEAELITEPPKITDKMLQESIHQ
jgi:hypothetical protein